MTTIASTAGAIIAQGNALGWVTLPRRRRGRASVAAIGDCRLSIITMAASSVL
jgi:hypothetical protein